MNIETFVRQLCLTSMKTSGPRAKDEHLEIASENYVAPTYMRCNVLHLRKRVCHGEYSSHEPSIGCSAKVYRWQPLDRALRLVAAAKPDRRYIGTAGREHLHAATDCRIGQVVHEIGYSWRRHSCIHFE